MRGNEREGYCSPSHHTAMVVVSRTYQIDTHINRLHCRRSMLPPPASSRACLYTNDGALMCVVKTENDCFRYTDMTCVRYRCWCRSIIADTEPIPAVSADTEYPMPVSVSPYKQPMRPSPLTTENMNRWAMQQCLHGRQCSCSDRTHNSNLWQTDRLTLTFNDS